MRVLVLASTYPRWRHDPEPGFVHELSRRLARHADVRVICPHHAGAARQEMLDGVCVYRFRYAPDALETLVYEGGMLGNIRQSVWKVALLPLFFFAQWMVLRRLVRKWKPDVVHAHWIIPQGLVAVLAGCGGRQGPRLLITSHGADLYALKGRLFNGLKRWVLSRAQGVTVVSHAMKTELTKLVGHPVSVSVRSMGVDLKNRFVPESSAETPVEKDDIVFVGRLVEKKGVDILIRAFTKIVNVRPQARLRIVGFGPEEPRLHQMVREQSLSERVLFEGGVPQDRLPEYYRSAAVVVAPFRVASGGDQEGLGLVLVEALGCGVPVVASDLPACRDILDASPGVVKVPPGNVSELAKGIVKALDERTVLRARLSAARKALESRFDWENVAMDYAEILKQVCR